MTLNFRGIVTVRWRISSVKLERVDSSFGSDGAVRVRLNSASEAELKRALNSWHKASLYHFVVTDFTNNRLNRNFDRKA